MSIVSDGLQPPGIAKILMPWSGRFCSFRNSLHFSTAESLILNIVVLLYDTVNICPQGGFQRLLWFGIPSSSGAGPEMQSSDFQVYPLVSFVLPTTPSETSVGERSRSLQW
jgi:hypothetical protein